MRLVIGNKVDLIDSAAQADIEEKAKEIAVQHSARYATVSAKTGENVNASFEELANRIERRG